MLTACPDCGSNIGAASKCRCGWTVGKSTIARPRVDCSIAGCATHATIREKMPTGWANFCEYHYVKAGRKQAEEWCRERGLVTLQDKVNYCRKIFPAIKPPPEREPGCDDEPRRYMRDVEPAPVAGS